MTLEMLQKEMIAAMKSGDKQRKGVLSMMIARIKKSAIDKGIRENIPEEMVNAELLSYRKSVKESIDTLPVSSEKWAQACDELAIVNEYAPRLIDNPDKILEIIHDEYEGPLTKKDLMKFFSTNYKGKVDMKIVGQAVNTVI